MGKGGLGKGLGSLMADAAEESGSNKTIDELPLKDIIPNPNQPRSQFDDKSLDELADSIKNEGLLQPIIVRPDGKKYQIIAGERRWQACKRLGMDTVPVRIMSVDKVETIKLALIENLQRTNLNPVEEARGYKDLIAASGMTQAELASSVSKSRTAIANSLRLLDLPEDVQELLYEGRLSAGHGRAILTVPDEEKRTRLANKVVSDNLSVRETENLARLYAAGELEHSKRTPTPRTFKKVAQRLRQQLGTNVRVKNSRGKNRIEIEFKDEDELERIFKIINGQGDAGGDINQV